MGRCAKRTRHFVTSFQCLHGSRDKRAREARALKSRDGDRATVKLPDPGRRSGQSITQPTTAPMPPRHTPSWRRSSHARVFRVIHSFAHSQATRNHSRRSP